MSSSPCFQIALQKLQRRKKQELVANAKKLPERPSTRKLEEAAVNVVAVAVSDPVVVIAVDVVDMEWAAEAVAS